MATPALLEKRSYSRVRPRGVVSLALFQGEQIPPAFGIVSDISENGACIHSDRMLVKGQRLDLRIQFQDEPELFEAQGWVRWTKPALLGENGVKGGALSGVEFNVPSFPAMVKLRRLLVSPDFEHLDSGSRQFEEFLDNIRPFLRKLGALLDEALRRGPGR